MHTNCITGQDAAPGLEAHVGGDDLSTGIRVVDRLGGLVGAAVGPHSPTSALLGQRRLFVDTIPPRALYCAHLFRRRASHVLRRRLLSRTLA